MKQVVARFATLPTVVLFLFCFGLSSFEYLLPVVEKRPIREIVLGYEWGWVWAIGALLMPLVLMAMTFTILKVIFKAGEAIVIEDASLVFLFRFFFTCDLRRIRSVTFLPRAGLYRNGGRIQIALDDGRMKYIGTELIEDEPEVVLDRIKAALSATAENMRA